MAACWRARPWAGICAAGVSPSRRSGGPWSSTRPRWRARPWLAEAFPAIRAQARREGGVVLWLEAMGSGRLRRRAGPGRRSGRPRVLKGTGKRFWVNMISAVSNPGMLRFRLVVGSFSGRVFIDFLGRLLRDCGGRKLHLIVDGHPVHRARLVSAWMGRHADQIELHVLPGYRPELNPVELLNHDGKANAAGRRRPRSAGELRAELHGYLRWRQRHPEALVRFFDHPTTRYAAAS